mmetsp:Transcript_5149/g.8467  ORF Transcript_5149/g.8467 Transcript_5149/m.8467 type:complete len:371 (-) Transcript_5149:212-1324(-)
MHSQIVTGSISVTNAFDPSVAGLDFQIPAVSCIVSHFRCQVLTESQTSGVHTNAFHKELGTGHKVGQRLIVDQTLGDSIAGRHSLGLTRSELVVPAKEDEILTGDCIEVHVILVLGVHKMLNFRHAKFADAKKTGTRGNFISKSQSNLRCRKGHLLRISIQEPSEIHKQALRRLRTQISDRSSFWTNGRPKHEVERKGGRIVRARRWLASIFREQFVEFSGSKGIRLALDAKVVLLFREGHARLLFQQVVNRIFQQFVGAKAFTRLGILHHEICEAINVTTSLQHDFGGQAGALHLQHRFGQDKMLSPDINHGCLQGTRRRTEIKQTLDTAMDFKRRNNKHLSQDQIVKGLAIELVIRVMCCLHSRSRYL